LIRTEDAIKGFRTAKSERGSAPLQNREKDRPRSGACDAAASMAIGDEVAIGMLRDERTTLREPFDGFSLTRFDGSRVTI
jgi:hypothetical protein